MGRPATPEDVDEICGSLPQTELGNTWGDRPTWIVPRGGTGKKKGKGCVPYRKPDPTALGREHLGDA